MNQESMNEKLDTIKEEYNAMISIVGASVFARILSHPFDTIRTKVNKKKKQNKKNLRVFIF